MSPTVKNKDGSIKYIPSIYDREFYLEKRRNSPPLRQLKLRTVLKFFKRRRSFQNIKQVALDRLEKTIYDQLDLLLLSDPFDYTNIESVAQDIFSWRKKKFLKRRRIKKTVWVDVLKMIANKDLLVRFKIRTDLKEIKDLISTLFSTIRGMKSVNMTQFDAIVNEPMRSIQTFSNIFEDLNAEKGVLLKEYRDAKVLFNTHMFRRYSARQETMLLEKEEAVVNSTALGPIDMRYQVKWYTVGVTMFDLRKTFMESSLKKSIQQVQFDTQVEESCSTNFHDICYDLSELYKHQIAHFQSRYDAEVEDIDNEMNYTRLQIKKLEDNRKFLNKEIERFHVEIKECLEKEAAERQAKIDEELERLRLEEEARLEKERKAKAKAKREQQKQKKKK